MLKLARLTAVTLTVALLAAACAGETEEDTSSQEGAATASWQITPSKNNNTWWLEATVKAPSGRYETKVEAIVNNQKWFTLNKTTWGSYALNLKEAIAADSTIVFRAWDQYGTLHDSAPSKLGGAPAPQPTTTSTTPPAPAPTTPGRRDARKWPFAKDSIWNMPIGSNARYVPAQIQPPGDHGMTVDEDVIIMKPTAPLTPVMLNTAGWSQRDRCTADSSNKKLFDVPIPNDFILGDRRPGTPNSGTAILMADGRTVKQTQPFSRCRAGGYATSQYTFADADLMGDGRLGAHGGSGMSTLGGTIRMGELTKAAGPIRHALKINLDARTNLANCSNSNDCYRWPAARADRYAVDAYGTLRNAPSVMKMGVLLALPKSVNIDSLGLETEPAKRLAWTMQNYGGYVVDDTAWRVYAVVVESGADGEVTDEFQREWGFGIRDRSKDSPWTRDMRRLFTALSVVDNNGPQSVGGGGTPVQPLAPDF